MQLLTRAQRITGFALSFGALTVILLLAMLPRQLEKPTASHRKESCQLYQLGKEFLVTPPLRDVMPQLAWVVVYYLPAISMPIRFMLVNRCTAPRAPPGLS